MNIVLTQEIKKYNQLQAIIKDSLQNLINAIEGV